MHDSIRNTVAPVEGAVGIISGIDDGTCNTIEIAQEGADYINSGATTAKQVSHSVRTVAVGAEEMNVSIKEISSNADSAIGVAKEAPEVAQ